MVNPNQLDILGRRAAEVLTFKLDVMFAVLSANLGLEIGNSLVGLLDILCVAVLVSEGERGGEIRSCHLNALYQALVAFLPLKCIL